MNRVHGVRDRSLHDDGPTDPAFARNPHILAWWTEEHDSLLTRIIERDRWLWYWSVADELAALMSREKLARWSGADPKVFRPEEGPEDEEGGREGTYASYNVLMYFARSRAETLGLTDAIRPADWKTYPLCGHRFREDSLWVPPARVYGAHNITHCSPCLEEAVHGAGDGRASEEKVLDYARQLARVLARPAVRRPTAPPLMSLPVLGSRLSSPSPLDLWSEHSVVCVEVSSMGWDVSLHAGYVPKVRPKRLQRHRPKNVFTRLACGLFADLRLKAHSMREEPMAREGAE